MKNQYFGDINDYRKYGLLRALQSRGQGRLLVAWMLTPEDGGRDGGFRSYLQQPEKWKHFDPDLYAGLAALLQSASTLEVSLIESSGLLPRTSYYSEVVPDSREDREVWRKCLLHAASGVDLVFVDPDNGIEVRSIRVGRKRSSKYVTWNEIKGIWDAGCSLLIYQHFGREPREAFVQRKVSELRRRTGGAFTLSFRSAHVLFLLVAQERHMAILDEGVARLRKRWGREIEVLEQPAG